MKIFKNYLILLSLVSFISCIDSNNISLKSNINIQIDGLFNEQDWKDAKLVNITDSTMLYLMQNNTELYLGIRNRDSVSRYVDLYIDNDSNGTINFHASMQLGERLLSGNWNDTIPAWSWGNNDQWYANKVVIINNNENISFQESLKPYEGYEFKISKRKIIGKDIRIRIEIRDFEGKADDIIFPLNSKRMNEENWYSLKLK